MGKVKIIKTDQEHEDALARIMELMRSGLEPESEESEELDLLALLIEKYEEDQFPIDPPDPIEAIKFRMDQQGLCQKDLVEYIGSASKVSEVLNRKRPLSLKMIRKLADGLGISAEVLIQDPEQRAGYDHEVQWHLFPLTDMRKRGYFSEFNGTAQELKEYSAEVVSRFISSVSNGYSLEPAMLRTSAHLRSNAKETDEHALWAWQIKVLQKAESEPLSVTYVPNTVDLDFMRLLAQQSWSEKGPLQAKELLNKHGIHLVIEEHLPKTYLDGAVCRCSDGNPVVALTLRHDRLDNFWFSLMHEMAHIALHLDETEEWFIDDLDARSTDPKEDEADHLAQVALIPEEKWVPASFASDATLESIAKSMNIHPTIIAGRMRHELNDHRLYGRKFRDKVRRLFQ